MAGSGEPLYAATATLRQAGEMLIVVAPYYKDIADNMIAGAKATAAEAGASVDLIEVPGALEVPTAIGMASAWRIMMVSASAA